MEKNVRKGSIILLWIFTLINTAALGYFAWLIYLDPKPPIAELEEQIREDVFVFPSDVYVPEEIALAGEAVPLQRWDVMESFRRELIVNTYLHSSTIQLIKNIPRYFAVIEPILKEEGVPDDFKYLAIAESNLNPWAISPSGAGGIWQFMKPTGKEYGLEVDVDVDERFHLEKSTRAACSYLKKSYQKFGSWTMAAAAYNAGSNAMSKQSESQKQKSYYDLYLNTETSRYVFRILALKQILENPRLYNFYVSEVYPEEEYELVKVSADIKDLAAFAQQQDISYKTLKRFNPWLRNTSLKVKKKKTYYIAIPKDKKAYQ